jgi:hypothetical protein
VFLKLRKGKNLKGKVFKGGAGDKKTDDEYSVSRLSSIDERPKSITTIRNKDVQAIKNLCKKLPSHSQTPLNNIIN